MTDPTMLEVFEQMARESPGSVMVVPRAMIEDLQQKAKHDARMILDMERHIEEQQAEIERLRAENERLLGMYGIGIPAEVQRLRQAEAENERLRASVDAHNEQLRQQTERATAAEDENEQWKLRAKTDADHAAESASKLDHWRVENSELRAEIERLQAQVNHHKAMETRALKQGDNLRAENEQLRAYNEVLLNVERENVAENERLKRALDMPL